MTATETTRSERWPMWAQVMIALLAILAIASIIPWLMMGTMMASFCSGMMGGMPMPMGR